MRKVAIVGVGQTKFDNLWNKDFTSISVEALNKSLLNAGVDRKEVEASYFGTMSSGLFNNQEHTASMIPDFAGLGNIPSTRVEAACASGGIALRQAYIDIASGMHDIVIAGGAEKMTDLGTSAVTKVLATAASSDWEANQGATFPGIYAMIAKRHMHQYKTTVEQLAQVAVKNHKNAIHNPYAQYRKEISVSDVLNSMMIADPIKLLECSPITDGGAFVVLASEEKAKKLTDTPIWINGSGHAVDTLSLHDREDITRLKATTEAARQAISQAKITLDKIGSVEVHDCFTIAEICAIEDLGFFKKGDGGRATLEGETQIGGKIAVNTSGGLKAKGHPIGASGIAQAIEAFHQLRGDAKGRQVNSDYAMTHNVGGSGATSVVHIFGRDKK